MKDKIEQLYISAIQGEWDSEYFAERMMELIGEPFVLVTSDTPTQNDYAKIIEMNKRGWYTPFNEDDTNSSIINTIKEASNPEHGIMFWNDGKFYSDVECTKEFKRK